MNTNIHRLTFYNLFNLLHLLSCFYQLNLLITLYVISELLALIISKEAPLYEIIDD